MRCFGRLAAALHDFGEGPIHWSNFKSVIVSTHYTNNTIKALKRLRCLRQKHLLTTCPLSPIHSSRVIYVIYNIHDSALMYVGQTYRTSFIRFQEHVREARKVLSKSTIRESVKPLYAAIAKHGFESFHCFPIEHIEGNFSNSKEFYKATWSRELYWMRTLHTFFPQGFNLEGKSHFRKIKTKSHKTLGEEIPNLRLLNLFFF